MITVRLSEKWCSYKKGELALVEERLGLHLCEKKIATPHGDDAERLMNPDLPPPEKLWSVQFVSRFDCYNPGEIAGFQRDKFLDLVQRGIARPMDEDGEAEVEAAIAQEPPSPPSPEVSEARLATVRDAIERIGPDDPQFWSDGKPAIEPLRQITGIADLHEAERDAVWAEFAGPSAQVPAVAP
jgi:hypothetical protein